MVTELQAQHQLALATTCRYLGVHRAVVRYDARRPSSAPLVAALRAWAERKPRWGSPRLTSRLRRDGSMAGR